MNTAARQDSEQTTQATKPQWRVNLDVYWRIARLLWEHPWQTIIATVCLIMATVCALLVPALLAWVIDVGVRHGSLSDLAIAALAIFGTSVLRGAFTYGQGYYSQAVSQFVAYDLRKRVYDHLQRLSFSYHDESQTGEVMSRLTVDIEAIRNFIVLALLRALLTVGTFVPVTVILLRLDWPLALVTLACIPILVVLAVSVARRLLPLWTSVQQETGALSTVMQESLAGIRVVKAFTREEYQIQRFNDKNREVRAVSLAAMRMSAWNQPLMVFVLNVVTVAVLWIGGAGVIGHRLSLGTLVAVTQYVLLLGAPVRGFGFMVNWFTRGLSSGRRLFEVLDQVPEIRDADAALPLQHVRGEVRFEHVSFQYGNGPQVLDDISIAAEPGQVIALLGATGSGKSTVLHLLPRFYDVSSGKVTVDGIDVRDVQLPSLRGAIGLVLQDVFLFNATLRENIAYGVEHATEEQIMAASRAARVHDYARQLPDGYDTMVGERGVTLSGGQKQRLAIARTLLRDPRILVLDDSTSSVDMETEYLIQQALQAVMKGRTTFVVASRLRTVKSADQILVLDHGRIVERGTHDTLLLRNGHYARLYDLQLREQEEFEQQVLRGGPQRQGESRMSTHSYVDTLTSRRQTGSRRNLLASLDEDESAQFNRELFRAIGQYIKPYKWQSILSVVLLAVYTFANLANPFLIGLAIDNYIQRGDSMGLGVISLVLLAVNVILWQAQYWQVWTMSWVGQETLTQLSADMFEHLQELSLSFFDRTEIGRVMSRLQSDIGVLEQMLSSGVLSLLGSVIALIGIIVIMLAMNAVLALLTFAVLPLMVIIAAFWQRYSQRSFRRTRATISLVNSTLQENISGMRVIQSLAREDRSRTEFDDLNRRNLDTNLEASRIGNYILPLVEVVAAMAIALVVIFGGLQVANHSLQVGVLVAFTLYINRFFDPIRDLTQQYMQLQRSSVAIERIFQILGIEVEVRDRPDAMILPPIVGNVEFQHVVFGYEATAPVLRDFDLTINAGQTVAIVGPTGAGKSTIAGLLQRLYDVQGGAIRVDGYNVQDVTQKSLRSQIGVVLQDPFLFSGTIRDNIRFGRLNATDQEVEDAARVVGAHELIERLPLGYETPIQERGQNLSVGQRQIISFARALLADPRVLILDEATANIDTLTELLVQQGMRRLLEGRTALVIAHRLSTIKNADVIVVLRAGRIVEKGTHAELLAVDGAYAKLYALGFRHAESAAS